MRLIIPENINKLLEQQAPYLHYVEGEGVVLLPDAPPEIVQAREITRKWFDEHEKV